MRRRIASGVIVAAVVVGALLLQRQRRQEAVTLAIDVPDSAAVTRLELDLVDQDHHLARRIDLRWPAGRAPTHIDRPTQLRRGAYDITARIYTGESVRLAQDRIQIAEEGAYPIRLAK
jgi:hypothetical protein